MRVSISVPGRFHLFNLAEELARRDMLERLITSYPRFEAVKYGIPKDRVVSILAKEILERSWRKLPHFAKLLYNPQYRLHEFFDHRVAGQFGRPDIMVGGSSIFLHTLRRAKAQGAITVVDHGSTHVLYQQAILMEEYPPALRTMPFQLPHPRLVEKQLQEYEEADYIAIPSLFAKRTFLERGIPERKIIHVPYGVDLGAFRQIPKEDDKFRVIFVGAMTFLKGVHYLLQAFAELKLPNAELLLIGTLNEEIKPVFKKYEGHYRYIGHVPQAELYKYYSQGSVFVLASIQEGLAVVQAQAMACGLPAIVTTSTGGEDIIRDGIDGFIIPIRNVEKIKEKIAYLYEHPEERARMGESAKAHVSSGFTWHDYGAKTIREYERILALPVSTPNGEVSHD